MVIKMLRELWHWEYNYKFELVVLVSSRMDQYNKAMIFQSFYKN